LSEDKCILEIEILFLSGWGGSLKVRLLFKDLSAFGPALLGVSLYAQQWALQDGHPCDASVLTSVAWTAS